MSSKRDFLRGKGLTEAEIDEAFRRVPQDAAPAVAPAAAPAAAAPSAVATTLQHLQPQPYVQQPGAVVPYQPPQPQGVRWTQVRAGLLPWVGSQLGAGSTAAAAQLLHLICFFCPQLAAWLAARSALFGRLCPAVSSPPLCPPRHRPPAGGAGCRLPGRLRLCCKEPGVAVHGGRLLLGARG